MMSLPDYTFEQQIPSPEMTQEIARGLGEMLSQGALICLSGELGAGKTCFVKGLVQGLRIENPEEVVSPTFALLNIYSGELTVYHFDLYRLMDYNDFIEIGGEDYLDDEGVIVIEWAEKIINNLPADKLWIWINYENTARRFGFSAYGNSYAALLKDFEMKLKTRTDLIKGGSS